MNKKVLFVLHSMALGGSMTSLLNLLELLKEKGYNVDLLIMNHSGPLMERAKNAANLLPENKRMANIISSPSKLKKDKDIFGLCERCFFIARKKLSRGKYNRESVYREQAKKYSGYDAVVAFQEGIPTDFVKYIDCKNKVAWIHNELKWIAGNNSYEKVKEIYNKFNKVVCVSEIARKSIEENLNLNKDIELLLVYNTLNKEHIFSKSKEFEIQTDKNVLNLISMGRFVEQKRFDRIIPVAKRLKADGRNFCWRILGAGEQLEGLKERAENEDLLDVLRFEGPQSNPYPYIAASDCFVLTSLYEAHPMVAIESLLLDKPVLSTDFPSAKEVITHGVNGLIDSNDEDGIYRNITKIFEDKELFEKLKDGAIKYDYDNEKILKQVIEIVEL